MLLKALLARRIFRKRVFKTISACVSPSLSLFLYPLSNQAEIARLLLSKGANVNLLNNSLCTALHIAVNKGFTDMVRVLTEHSADVNLQVSRPDSLSTGRCCSFSRCILCVLYHMHICTYSNNGRHFHTEARFKQS